MDRTYTPAPPIFFPAPLVASVIDHCRKNLAATGTDDAARQRKAYGLVAGLRTESAIEICRCFPLSRNARAREPFKSRMDKLMTEHAIRSETPLDQRGWVADPQELLAIISQCRAEKLMLLGTYHMHRVAWLHDPLRDTPTRIDTVLAEKSGLIMFIISMVNPDRPLLRAFHEGIATCEYPIVTR